MITWVKTITVISSDGDEFEIAINVAEQSKLIKSMLNDVSVSGNKVPLYNVNSVTLAKVIEYCQKHVDYEAAANNGATNNASDGMEELKKWDDEFLKAHKCDLLFDIILAANYLEITGLLNSSCQAVADMIKGKTPEQIRHIFNIKNDFTPEEEEQIRRENQWAFDN